ncbi:MAG: UxaA family hydrolase [Bauldia sp.]|nr:UxaA family hydrolase [Bauldia sp.]
MTQAANIVVLATADNVGIAVSNIEANEMAQSTSGQSATATEAIPLGHKIALRPVAAGEKIVRLSMPVGIATADIAKGALVHVHNVRSQYLDNVEDHYE